jgi:hypothetical protein
MAVAAYDRARPLDNDGRYHLAVLHLVGNRYGDARAQADTILASNPKHLFGLFTGRRPLRAQATAAAPARSTAASWTRTRARRAARTWWSTPTTRRPSPA